VRVVAQDRGPRSLQLGLNAGCHVEVAPIRAVVVVAEHGERGETTARQVREDAAELRELALAAVDAMREGVAGEHHHVGAQGRRAGERADDVRIAHARADVHVAQLRERGAVECRGEPGDAERPPHDLQPLRLDAERVAEQPDAAETRRAGCPAQEVAPPHAGPPREGGATRPS
jgi:hypothetical protein